MTNFTEFPIPSVQLDQSRWDAIGGVNTAAGDARVPRAGADGRLPAGWMAQETVRQVDTVTDLIADTTLGALTSVGDYIIVREGPYSYQRVADDEATFDLETAEGLRFRNTRLWTLNYGVGAGGDFASMNAALERVADQRRGYRRGGVAVTLTLLEGFVMAEQVVAAGIDLSFIRLVAENSHTVPIARDALTLEVGSRYPAFCATDGGALPILDALFEMNSDGTATARDGIFLRNRGFVNVNPGAGIKSAGSRGLHVSGASLAYCRNGVFDDAGEHAFRISNGSVVQIRGSSGQNAGAKGIATVQNCIISATDVNLSGAGEEAISIERGGSVDFTGGTANNCGAGDARAAILATGVGASINVTNATANNAAREALYARDGAQISGVSFTGTGAGRHGALAQDNGRIVLTGSSNLDNAADNALYALDHGAITFRGTARNAGARPIFASDGGTVDARTVDGTGGTNGARAIRFSTIYLRSANMQVGGSPSSDDISVLEGSTIYAEGATGGLGQIANVKTLDGIIITDAVTENRGYAIVPDGSTTVVVTHGLSLTPNISDIQLTARNNLGNAAKFWVSATASTTFTISVNADPGAGGAVITWAARLSTPPLFGPPIAGVLDERGTGTGSFDAGTNTWSIERISSNQADMSSITFATEIGASYVVDVEVVSGDAIRVRPDVGAGAFGNSIIAGQRQTREGIATTALFWINSAVGTNQSSQVIVHSVRKRLT